FDRESFDPHDRGSGGAVFHHQPCPDLAVGHAAAGAALDRRSAVDQRTRGTRAGNRRSLGPTGDRRDRRTVRAERPRRAVRLGRAVRPAALMPAKTIFVEAACAPPLSLLLGGIVLYGVSP